MNAELVIALIGFIIVIMAHTVVIARWSGRIDGYLEAAANNFTRVDCEIERLRDAKHDASGQLQKHTGQIRAIEGRLHRIDHEPIGDD